MDYNHIKNYFDKFKNILFSKEENSRIVSIVLKKNIGLELETKNIQIKGDILYLKISPLVRNEILINKNQILKDLNSSISNNIFRDIR